MYRVFFRDLPTGRGGPDEQGSKEKSARGLERPATAGDGNPTTTRSEYGLGAGLFDEGRGRIEDGRYTKWERFARSRIDDRERLEGGKSKSSV